MHVTALRHTVGRAVILTIFGFALKHPDFIGHAQKNDFGAFFGDFF